jgi:arylformamidase
MKSRITFAAVLLVACSLLTVPVAAQQRNAPANSADGWVDITAPIDPKVIPVYPGDAGIKLEFLQEFRTGGKLTLSTYTFGAHTGTHIDAPLHFVAGGATIDKVSFNSLIGPVRVIDCSADAMAIDGTELNKHQWRGAKRILFRTRNSRNHWMSDPTFHKDFTYVAPDAAQLLADAGVVLVGIDYISMEKFGAAEPKTHVALLGKNIPIVEGVDLSNVSAGDYDLIILPLRVPGHEAAPARAVLKKR